MSMRDLHPDYPFILNNDTLYDALFKWINFYLGAFIRWCPCEIHVVSWGHFSLGGSEPIKSPAYTCICDADIISPWHFPCLWGLLNFLFQVTHRCFLISVESIMTFMENRKGKNTNAIRATHKSHLGYVFTGLASIKVICLGWSWSES